MKSRRAHSYEFFYERKDLDDDDLEVNYQTITLTNTTPTLVLSDEWVVKSNPAQTIVYFQRATVPQGAKLIFAAIYSLSELGSQYDKMMAECDADLQTCQARNQTIRQELSAKIDLQYKQKISKIKKKDKKRATKIQVLETEKELAIQKLNSRIHSFLLRPRVLNRYRCIHILD